MAQKNEMAKQLNHLGAKSGIASPAKVRFSTVLAHRPQIALATTYYSKSSVSDATTNMAGPARLAGTRAAWPSPVLKIHMIAMPAKPR